jgi:hypothetical protein
MNKIITALVIVAIVLIGAFFAFNNYIYQEKQPDTPTSERTVSLYYYNPELDTVDGNIMCSDAGLVAVERTLAESESIISDTLSLLLQGNLTDVEIADGTTTEFPLSGLTLENVSLDPTGQLSIALNDPENTTVGGSCRVSVLYAQIQATALQFDDVNTIEITPAELFQP